jgi:hypothetical protein
MEATDYDHRGHKAFATSRSRGMRILSPAGRFGRIRLPPGCRPDRPRIAPIRRLIRKPRRRPSPLLSPQPLVSVFRLGRGARHVVTTKSGTRFRRDPRNQRFASRSLIGPHQFFGPTHATSLNAGRADDGLAVADLSPPMHRVHTPQTRADAASISTRDLRDADLPQSQKSTALFWNICEMPNGSHGIQPSRPQSLCNFTSAGDAYSVSSRTVRSPQVAPWLSTGPSAYNAYPPPDAQAASPVIPTVIASAIGLSLPSWSWRTPLAACCRRIRDSHQGR